MKLAFGLGGSVSVRFWSGARGPGVWLGVEGKAGVAVDLGHVAQTRWLWNTGRNLSVGVSELYPVTT